jgi:uncharacterized membrane protein YraQ (UPF0718 family)
VNKRSVVLLGALALLLVYFWSDSRVPQLEEKTANVGSSLTEAFTDRPIYDIVDSWPLWRKTLASTVNWLNTNTVGMTTGILVGAIALSLLTGLRRRRFDNRYLNLLLGIAVGSPLGLCANCAAPIAKGAYDGGASAESSLALMFSSPKFNIIVFSMILSIFPLYLILIQYAFVVLFIMVVLPALLTLSETMNSQSGPFAQDPAANAFCPVPLPEPPESWGQAALAAGKDFVGSLKYIVIRTLPLMILAGTLASVAIHLFDLQYFAGTEIHFVGMLLATLIALFLPMPIAVDILLTAILYQSGVPTGYVAVFFFSLGIYSVYTHFIVWRYFSRSLSLALVLSLFVLSLLAGYTSHIYSVYDRAEQDEFFRQNRGGTDDSTQRAYSAPSKVSGGAIVPKTYRHPVGIRRSAIDTRDASLSVEAFPYQSRAANDDPLFTKLLGRDLGLDFSDAFHFQQFHPPLRFGQGMAGGDFDNDGKLDLVFARDPGISLYRNTGGHFEAQEIDLGPLGDASFQVVAFVDIDNDGWKDLFLSTFTAGNYFLMNRDGVFSTEALVPLSAEIRNSVTMGVSFADLTGNGKLDIALGNYIGGFTVAGRELPRAAGNQLVYTETETETETDNPTANPGLRFSAHDLNSLEYGQTLSLLFSDFNNDGRTDLLVANDFGIDESFIGTEDGFRRVDNRDALFEQSPWTTMSVATADTNNDLLLDTFSVGFGGKNVKHKGINVATAVTYSEAQKQFEREVKQQSLDSGWPCHDLSPAGAKSCRLKLEILAMMKIYPFAAFDVRECRKLRGRGDVFGECLENHRIMRANKRRDANLCELIQNDYRRTLCRRIAILAPRKPRHESSIPFVEGQNAFHLGTSSGGLENRSSDSALGQAGWAWNALFADVNNDGWQDALVVNGFLLDTQMRRRLYDQNHFFLNREGVFERKQIEAGLGDLGITHAYVYLDFDGDGDLDIVTRSILGQIYVYRNNENQNHMLSIELEDHLGNRDGIGSKVYIEYGGQERLQQLREIKIGGGFVSHSPAIAHFGIGAHLGVEGVRIVWPDGATSQLKRDFPAGMLYRIIREP